MFPVKASSPLSSDERNTTISFVPFGRHDGEEAYLTRADAVGAAAGDALEIAYLDDANRLVHFGAPTQGQARKLLRWGNKGLDGVVLLNDLVDECLCCSDLFWPEARAGYVNRAMVAA
jgi:hypothetical protein